MAKNEEAAEAADRKIALCDICGERETLVRDREPGTGRARGWLCIRCNGEMIVMEAIPLQILRNAKEYLERWDPGASFPDLERYIEIRAREHRE